MIRVRPEGITPVELWDLIVPEGGILWDHQQSPNFGEVLRGAAASLWQGAGVSRSDGPVLVPRFDAVHLAGGRAETVLIAMQRGPWRKVSLAVGGPFAGEAGGLALLRERGFRGWVLDLGQSSLKLSNGDTRLSRARDWKALPLRVDGTIDPAQRQRLRRWMARTLLEFRELCGAWPEALTAALPSRLDDAGVPEGSSYAGMTGDANLLPDAMSEADLPDIPVFVLNDAELAAASARVTHDIETVTLVLTIGFGVGGAWITP